MYNVYTQTEVLNIKMCHLSQIHVCENDETKQVSFDFSPIFSHREPRLHSTMPTAELLALTQCHNVTFNTSPNCDTKDIVRRSKSTIPTVAAAHD